MTLINKIASLNTIDLDVMDYKFTGYNDFTAEDIYTQDAFVENLTDEDFYEDRIIEIDPYEADELAALIDAMDREDRCIEYVLPFLFQHCEHVNGLDFCYNGSPLRFFYLLKDRLYSDKALTTVDHITIYKIRKEVIIGFSGARVSVNMESLTQPNYELLSLRMANYLLSKVPYSVSHEYDAYHFYENFYVL